MTKRPWLLERGRMAIILLVVAVLPVLGWPLAVAGIVQARREHDRRALVLYALAFALSFVWLIPVFTDFPTPTDE